MRKYYNSTAFLDLLFNCLLGFVYLFIVTFILVNPQKEESKLHTQAEYVITLTWELNNPDDVDIWLRNPAQQVLFFRKKEININVLVVGINEEGKRIAKTFNKNGIEKINVVGFLDKKQQLEKIKRAGELKDVNVLGVLEDLEKVIKKFNVNRIVISSHSIKYFNILQILERVGNLNIEVQMSPSLFEFSVSRMKIFEYMGIPLIQIQKITIKGRDKLFKILIDYFIAILLFLIFILLFPIIAILIKSDSKGPVLYSQERYGKDFKKIKLYNLEL